jgi:hypothetical protein
MPTGGAVDEKMSRMMVVTATLALILAWTKFIGGWIATDPAILVRRLMLSKLSAKIGK